MRNVKHLSLLLLVALVTGCSGSPAAEPDTADSFSRGALRSERLAESFSKSKKIPLIVIDPGHGGVEEGAKGVNGILEKDVVLEISKKMDTLLRNELGVNTLLTRKSDLDIPLEQRTKMANDNGADLFISVHANASLTKQAQGIETYYLDNTDDKSSLKLAKRENTTQTGGGLDDLSFIISDLIQNAKLDESISLAHHIQNALHSHLSREYEGVKNLGVKKAPFYVLVGAHMPCVLVEVSFIDHPKEGKLLTSSRYQKVIAWALVDGVRSFLESR